MLTRPSGTGAMPDVPVADEAHPGIAGTDRRRSRAGGTSGRGAGRAGRAAHARRPSHDRAQPIGTDDHVRSRSSPRCRPADVAPSRPADGSTATSSCPARPHDPAAGRHRARSSSAGSSRDRSKPTAVPPPASAPYVRRNVVPRRVSTRIAGIGRVSLADRRLAEAERGAARHRRPATRTPRTARQRQVGDRSIRTTSWPALASLAASAEPAGPPPTIATSTARSSCRRLADDGGRSRTRWRNGRPGGPGPGAGRPSS